MSYICEKCIETKTYLSTPLRLSTIEKLIAYKDTQYSVIGYDTLKNGVRFYLVIFEQRDKFTKSTEILFKNAIFIMSIVSK